MAGSCVLLAGEGGARYLGREAPMNPAHARPDALPGARYALLVLTAMNLLNYLDRYVPSAVKELVKEDLHLTDTQTSLPLTSFVWVYMLASPIFGALADRVSRPKLIAIGVLLWSLATAGAAFATTFAVFLVARALVGVGEAAYATLTPPLLSDYYAPSRRNRILTVFYVAIPVGSALGFALGGAVGARWGWPAAFLVAGVPGILAAVAALRIQDPPRGSWEEAASPVVPSWPEAIRVLLRTPGYVIAVAGYTAVTFAQGAMADWFPSFLVRNPALGMDVGQAGLLVGATAVVGGLGGTLLGGWLGDRLIPYTRQPYLAISAGSMVFAILATVGALTFQVKGLVIASMFLAQFFLWFYNGPINALIANSSDAAFRARAFALSILSIHLLGDSISPTIVGTVSDALDAAGDPDHLTKALILIPAAMAVGATIWAWGWRKLPVAGA